MGTPFQTPGAFSWAELLTGDLEAAKEYYRALLGWELEPAPMGDANYTVIKAAGQPIGGMMTMPPTIPPGVPPHWGVYVTVEDVDATAARAAELGGAVLVGPQDIPEVGRFAVLQDPQGAVLSVIHYQAPCPEHESADPSQD